MTARGRNGAAARTRPSSPGRSLADHHPPPRSDGVLPITITHLEMDRPDWTQRGQPPALPVAITREASPSVALYRQLYDSVGRPWLWYERRLLSDDELGAILAKPDHELHIVRDAGKLVGYFELGDSELMFFGLTLPYIGRRIGPWLLDRAIERAFASGMKTILLNTNTLDHPGALTTYCKAGFRIVRRESKDLRDPRILWPEVYRWPAA
jgi:GNAT superfamily N-acetyltransferase